LGFREDTQRQIAALRAAGIEIVDTTPALSQRGENERMFYWLDIHLTKAGNETVTDAVMPTLQDTTDSRYE
jgi:hypothetical protein